MALELLTARLVGDSVGQTLDREASWSRRGLEEGRIFWSGFSSIVEAIPFIPITVNVPDIIYGMGDMLNNMYQYIFGTSQDPTSETDNSPRMLVAIIEQFL